LTPSAKHRIASRKCGTLTTGEAVHSVSSWRRPGPITPAADDCAKLGPRPLSQQTPVVMGPGFRQDDGKTAGGAPA
jgi:hypothetical protein